MSKVKPSAKFIASNAESVFVDSVQCRSVAGEIAARMQEQSYSTATWSNHPLNPDNAESDPRGTVDWIFTVDCPNFSFWSDDETKRFSVSYRDKEWTGYWSMVAAVNRALDEHIPFTSPKFWVSPEFTPELLAHVFRSSSGVEAPLMAERFTVLTEAGRALHDAGFTSFYDVVAQMDKSAVKLVDWVASHIVSFDDAPIYRGRKVFIYKRAQILAADIWASFQGHNIGTFTDIDELTMFADYRVPQILAVLGCLKYTPDLDRRIKAHESLTSGCSEEVEIRGCSIEAVELIVEEIKSLDPQATVNAVIVDFYLWDTAKEQEKRNTEIFECHRTRSVYY